MPEHRGVRLMVRSNNGNQYHRKEVWSTFIQSRDLDEIDRERTALNAGGIATATCFDDRDYERFCSYHRIS